MLTPELIDELINADNIVPQEETIGEAVLKQACVHHTDFKGQACLLEVVMEGRELLLYLYSSFIEDSGQTPLRWNHGELWRQIYSEAN